jgi:hypothetical protein
MTNTTHVVWALNAETAFPLPRNHREEKHRIWNAASKLGEKGFQSKKQYGNEKGGQHVEGVKFLYLQDGKTRTGNKHPAHNAQFCEQFAG